MRPHLHPPVRRGPFPSRQPHPTLESSYPLPPKPASWSLLRILKLSPPPHAPPNQLSLFRSQKAESRRRRRQWPRIFHRCLPPSPESAPQMRREPSPRCVLASKPLLPHTPPTRSNSHRSTWPPSASDRDAPDFFQTPSATDPSISPPALSGRDKPAARARLQTPPTAHHC